MLRERDHQTEPVEAGGKVPSPVKALLPAYGGPGGAGWWVREAGCHLSLSCRPQDAGPDAAPLDWSPPRARQLPEQCWQPGGGQWGVG